MLPDEEFQEQESELWTEIKELEKLITASEGKIKKVFVCFQSHKILNLNPFILRSGVTALIQKLRLIVAMLTIPRQMT